MNFYQLRYSLASGINQTDVLQKVKSAGGDGVQSSDGLFVAVPLEKAALVALFAEEGPALQVDVNPTELTPDLAAFKARF